MRFILKNKSIAFLLFNFILLATLVFLSFPLYKFFSYVTGYNKKIELSDNQYVKDSAILNPSLKKSEIIDRIITIKINAEVDNSLNWQFKSLENIFEIKVGESKIIKFEGKNLTNRLVTSTADFRATPEKILPYLIKTECFCFTEQTLKPGESQIFSMVFFLDSSLDKDSNLEGLKELVLTYKFSEFKS